MCFSFSCCYAAHWSTLVGAIQIKLTISTAHQSAVNHFTCKEGIYTHVLKGQHQNTGHTILKVRDRLGSQWGILVPWSQKKKQTKKNLDMNHELLS